MTPRYLFILFYIKERNATTFCLKSTWQWQWEKVRNWSVSLELLKRQKPLMRRNGELGATARCKKSHNVTHQCRHFDYLKTGHTLSLCWWSIFFEFYLWAGRTAASLICQNSATCLLKRLRVFVPIRSISVRSNDNWDKAAAGDTADSVIKWNSINSPIWSVADGCNQGQAILVFKKSR